MKRSLRLLAIGIALWSGAVVHAQGPMPYPPQGYGYPSYPMSSPYPPQAMPTAYGQPMMPYGQPMMPYGQPMMPYGQPTMPYGQPMRQPAMMPMMMPANQPMMPQPSAGMGQPYYVTDLSQNKTPAPIKPALPTTPVPAPAPEVLPSVPDGEPVTIYQGASTGQPLEDEPVALYEGKRYFAEVKLDNTMTWLQANYLHWWINQPTAVRPLVTSGSSTLLGGEIGPRELSGIQAQLGFWLDTDHKNAIEITGLWLGKSSAHYSFSSNAAGSPALSIPTAAGAIPVATPGALAGNILVNDVVSFYGAEINFTQNVHRINGWTLDYFYGARYLYMNDNLSINQSRTALNGAALKFAGAAVPAGSNVQIYDSFNVNNSFFGGNLGARVNWTCYGFDIGLTAKVALGATNYLTFADGSSTLTTPAGAVTTRTGGTFVQPSNGGRISDTQFSAIPEVDAIISYQLTCNLRILGGYSFLYWNHVQRAADQLDRSGNPAQAPTSPAFNANASGSPLFPNARSELFIQGVNIGLELKY